MTAADGSYLTPAPAAVLGAVRIRVQVPGGFQVTTPDQGTDDLLDSDIDAVTHTTPPIGPGFSVLDPHRWSAGLTPDGACWAPFQAIHIVGARLIGATLVLDMQDADPPQRVTGYNVYRSSDPTVSPALWPLLAGNVPDMDATTADIQSLDSTGDVSPSGIWYYQATAHNSPCHAEKPF